VTVPLPDLDSGSHTITYRWTIPSSNDPVLVDVQPTDLREPEIAYQTILPTPGRLQPSVSTEGQGSVQGEVLLNGQHLTNLNVASSAVNVMPLLRRARSGLYLDQNFFARYLYLLENCGHGTRPFGNSTPGCVPTLTSKGAFI
jgi:hypothetical protein